MRLLWRAGQVSAHVRAHKEHAWSKSQACEKPVPTVIATLTLVMSDLDVGVTYAGLSAEGSKPPTPWICANVGHANFMLDSLGGFHGDHTSNDPFSSPFHNPLSPFMGVSPLACLPLDGESSFCESPLGAHMESTVPHQQQCASPMATPESQCHIRPHRGFFV
jgi:hypothetical protein